MTCGINSFNNLNRAVVKPFPKRRKYRIVLLRSFYTLASACGTSISSFVQRPSSFVLTGCLKSLDAPQRSDEWFALRKDRLTTSTFSTALGFWRGNRRFELWQEKVYSEDEQLIESAKRFAMDWGVQNEATAIDRYKSITGRDVSLLGFAVHPEERLGWIGASPDGLLDGYPGGGILEVKCPYNKGNPDKGLPWSKMPFYYMPQVQGQMEVMDRDWVDLYCWMPNGSTVFRVCRDREYWALIHGILQEFWWENVIPAREALLLGNKEEADSYKPTSTHRQTGLAISKSLKLAGEVKLLCREIAGHVEFYQC
ncbi:OLC1v1007834C4 [Oldenlandia corymbosa var. corymbosa]|uniref:OLC1v1007834C4 n=1 Tax=Oldenlandia corymbosa var. corymbosa TaxID=529605 RepID=A0AAV1DNI8_OLDCO|nr:OLC1v1007834C4 [Oldenlandia corymbosa var. corymbosa]